MTLRIEDQVLYLSEQVSVEDAEAILDWFLQNPSGAVDLEHLAHLHAANLQVLMAVRPMVRTWPKEPELQKWLEAALSI